MVHARWVRPRGQGAYGTGAKIVSVDESSIKHIPGASVVRKGDFLAVVAPDRVRRDPRCRAVEGAVEGRAAPALDREPVEADAGAGLGRQGPGASPRDRGQRRHGAQVGGEDRLADLQVPLQRPRGDRPVRGRGRRAERLRGRLLEHAAADQHRHGRRHRSSGCRPRTCGRTSTRARPRTASRRRDSTSLRRRRSSRSSSASRSVSSSCAGTSTAGTCSGRRS